MTRAEALTMHGCCMHGVLRGRIGYMQSDTAVRDIEDGVLRIALEGVHSHEKDDLSLAAAQVG